MAHHQRTAHFRILAAEVEESHQARDYRPDEEKTTDGTATSQKALWGELCMVQAQFELHSLVVILHYTVRNHFLSLPQTCKENPTMTTVLMDHGIPSHKVMHLMWEASVPRSPHSCVTAQ